MCNFIELDIIIERTFDYALRNFKLKGNVFVKYCKMCKALNVGSLSSENHICPYSLTGTVAIVVLLPCERFRPPQFEQNSI